MFPLPPIWRLALFVLVDELGNFLAGLLDALETARAALRRRGAP
jgi:hypothetical protein